MDLACGVEEDRAKMAVSQAGAFRKAYVTA
jgi:hypothetical protein